MPGDSSSAEVVIKRPWALEGSAWAWKVFVDDRQVDKLRSGKSVTLNIDEGTHSILVRQPVGSSRNVPFPLNVKAGERVELVAQGVGAFGLEIRLLNRSRKSEGSVRRDEEIQMKPSDRSGHSPQTETARTPPDRSVTRPVVAIESSVVEGSRYESSLRDEVRTIDNLKSSSATTQTIRLSKEWTKTFSVDVERLATTLGSAGINMRILDLRKEAERTLSRTYSVAAGERETFEEEVVLTIAPYTKSSIVFTWKEVRQKGVVRIAGDGLEVQIPFEIVVGITFEQRKVDVS